MSPELNGRRKPSKRTRPPAIEFAQATEPGSEHYYLKQAWGAYGAAYRSQLFEIGMFDESEAHDLPIPSPQIGDRLAAAFEEKHR
ncbi:hypothetical protein LJR234_006639 [Mesorhizobium amorphae]|uniref:hypothetical protein n=1 Tax=Mesorhizobium amorphae TaxID=71433 RepID=UPI003ED0513A